MKLYLSCTSPMDWKDYQVCMPPCRQNSLTAWCLSTSPSLETRSWQGAFRNRLYSAFLPQAVSDKRLAVLGKQSGLMRTRSKDWKLLSAPSQPPRRLLTSAAANSLSVTIHRQQFIVSDNSSSAIHRQWEFTIISNLSSAKSFVFTLCFINK